MDCPRDSTKEGKRGLGSPLLVQSASGQVIPAESWDITRHPGRMADSRAKERICGCLKSEVLGWFVTRKFISRTLPAARADLALSVASVRQREAGQGQSRWREQRNPHCCAPSSKV